METPALYEVGDLASGRCWLLPHAPIHACEAVLSCKRQTRRFQGTAIVLGKYTIYIHFHLRVRAGHICSIHLSALARWSDRCRGTLWVPTSQAIYISATRARHGPF